jgi:hypothetical protein
MYFGVRRRVDGSGCEGGRRNSGSSSTRVGQSKIENCLYNRARYSLIGVITTSFQHLSPLPHRTLSDILPPNTTGTNLPAQPGSHQPGSYS